MVQCFVKKEYEPPFSLNPMPRLFSCSKTEADASIHPRVMHAHEKLCEIVLVCGGESKFFVGGQMYAARRGELFVFNSGVVHDEHSGPEAMLETYSLAFGRFCIDGLPENCLIRADASPVYHLDDAQTQRLEALYAVLYAELRRGNDDGSHHLLMSILSACEHTICTDDVPPSSQKNLLAGRIKMYIDENFKADFSLQTLSETLNVSPYYAAHVFKDAVGYSPLQYALRRRIGEAQTLLITTDLPITQIAGRVGYDNVSHFNAQFLKAIGLSPRAFRKAYVVRREQDSESS